MPPLNIVCLSHLAWQQGLFQRPQQLMREMAQRGHRVLYLGCVGNRESRRLAALGEAQGEVAGLNGGGLAFVNSAYPAFPSKLMALRKLLAGSLFIRKRRTFFQPGNPTIAWYYHPSLPRLYSPNDASLSVYDVMDRFDAFDSSHPGVAGDERNLVANADVLFSGGKSLQSHLDEAIRASGATAVPTCLPSGVDLDHFSSAITTSALPADVKSISPPILGYFGAIDERIDFELLQFLARERPQWNFVFIGPKLVDPANLPGNIHLLGPKPYGELPSYLSAFSVALLPFRQSRLVSHISPTKTPEYLAGGKPVVSTRIPDVESDYGDVVSIAIDPNEFLAACERAIANPPPPADLIAVAKTRARTWAQIANIMETEILLKLEKTARG